MKKMIIMLMTASLTNQNFNGYQKRKRAKKKWMKCRQHEKNMMVVKIISHNIYFYFRFLKEIHSDKDGKKDINKQWDRNKHFWK